MIQPCFPMRLFTSCFLSYFHLQLKFTNIAGYILFGPEIIFTGLTDVYLAIEYYVARVDGEQQSVIVSEVVL